MKKQKQPNKTKKKYGTVTDRHLSKRNVTHKRPSQQSSKSRTSCPCGNEDLLPWWMPYAVVMVTMVVRVNYVRQSSNWWILHPDEVFQSVEVAFSEVYGFGFRPYEYLPPTENVTTPAEQQLAQSGMYSLRSFMLPRVYAAVLTVVKGIGVHDNSFLTCRIFHAMVSSTLPATVFLFMRKLFRCRLLATLTCAITALSFHMTLFGTHTLVNSFIAPFLFLGLAICFPVSSSHDDLITKSSKPNKSQRTVLKQNDGDCSSKQTISSNCKRTIQDQNGNIVSRNDGEDRRTSDGSVGSTDSSLNELICQTRAYRRWWGSDSSASSRTDNDVAIVHCDIKSAISGVMSMPLPEVMKLVGGGFLVGISCYIRVDGSLFVVVVFIPLFVVTDTGWSVKIFGIAWSCLGGTFGLLLCGFEDYNRYGQWFLSPIQWITFNVLNERARIMYTTGIHSNYLDILFPGYAIKCAAIAMTILLFYSLVNETEMCHKYNFCSVVFSFITLCIIYSSVGHSQARFLHNVFVIQLILTSYVFHHAVQLLACQGHIDSPRQKYFVLSLLLATLSCFAAISYANFPSASDGSASSWAYRDAKESRDSNSCLDFIQKQANVRGVVIDTPLYATGGYSLLKHDVPILVMIHNEYHLYKATTDTHLANKSKLRILNNFSDYIHINNQYYRRILLAGSNTFNFAVTSLRHRTFYQNIKYTEVFSAGNIMVFERNLSESKEAKLNKNTLELHVGYNATILEYESNWLITNGLYQLAIVRAERALELSTERVRTFQQLVVAYFELGRLEKAREYERMCIRIHSYDTCSKQQEKVILHDEYKLFEKI